MKKEKSMNDAEFQYKVLKETEEAFWDLIFIFIGITIMCIPAMLTI